MHINLSSKTINSKKLIVLQLHIQISISTYFQNKDCFLGPFWAGLHFVSWAELLSFLRGPFLYFFLPRALSSPVCISGVTPRGVTRLLTISESAAAPPLTAHARVVSSLLTIHGSLSRWNWCTATVVVTPHLRRGAGLGVRAPPVGKENECIHLLHIGIQVLVDSESMSSLIRFRMDVAFLLP